MIGGYLARIFRLLRRSAWRLTKRFMSICAIGLSPTSSVAGQQLYEKELMQEYQIGRTPLREIFQELQRNGLIEIIPKLGTRVVTLDLRTLRETIQLRRELEGLAAELAALHIEPAQFKRLQYLLESAR